MNGQACMSKGSVMLQAKMLEQNATDILEEVRPLEIVDAAAAAPALPEVQAAPERPNEAARSFLAEFEAFQQVSAQEEHTDNDSFIDEKGYKCRSWDGYPCEKATEKWSYSVEGQANLLSQCPVSCGVSEDGCADVPDWKDEKGYLCYRWEGYNCADAVERWSYSNEGQEALIQNCAASCKTCDGLKEEEKDTLKKQHAEEEEEKEEKEKEEEEAREKQEEDSQHDDSQYDDSQYDDGSLYGDDDTTMTTTAAATPHCLCGSLNFYQDMPVPGAEMTCGKKGLMEWACSKEAAEHADHRHWMQTICCGTKTPEEMKEYQKTIADGSCLCGEDNFYEGLEVPHWDGHKCGKNMNSMVCALNSSDQGRMHVQSECCGKETLDERRQYMESLKTGSCLCGSKNFYTGLPIPHWPGRTCGVQETSWACPMDASDGGRKYLSEQCCGEESIEERQKFEKSLQDGSCLCGDASAFHQGKTIPNWGGSRTCGEEENAWACKRPDDDGGRRYLVRHCCNA